MSARLSRGIHSAVFSSITPDEGGIVRLERVFLNPVAGSGRDDCAGPVLGRCFALRRQGRVEGEEDAEGGAAVLALARAQSDLSLMFCEDALRDPEAKSGTGETFGREEWFEDAFPGLAVHALPGVRNGDADTLSLVLPVAAGSGAEAQFTSGGHGVDRVPDEVGEHLADLPVIG